MAAVPVTFLYVSLWVCALFVLRNVFPTCVACIYSEVSVFLLSTWLGFAFYPFFKKIYFDERVRSQNKAVLITGCDSGFGHELAKRLASKGFKVFAACLSDTSDGASALKETSKGKLHVIKMDVRKDEDVSNALSYVKSNIENSSLWAVVNNAGIYRGFDVALTKIDDFIQTLETNTIGPVRVTKAFLPLLLESEGRVVTVTSISSWLTGPHAAAYTMSKFAAKAFCETLRQEMNPFGVKVIQIEPETFRTPICTDVLPGLDACGNELDENTRSLYNEQYFEKLKRNLKTIVDHASTRIYIVVDALEDAVTLLEPNNVYRPRRNLFFTIIFFFLENIPKPFFESLVQFGRYTGYFPTPTKMRGF